MVAPTATKEEASGWFESIGLEGEQVLSSPASEGPLAKKKKREEGPKGPVRYPWAKKFYSNLQASHS